MAELIASTTNINIFFANANIRFQDAYRNAPEPFWPQLATLVPSTSSTEVYGWGARVSQLRPWIGDRQAASISTYSQTVANVHFERSLEINRDDFEDAKFGLFNFSIDDLARAAKKWPDTLLVQTLFNGQSQVCFDGANFFDTSHPTDKYVTGSPTQSNYFTSTPLTFDNYGLVRSKMMSILGEDGLPFGVTPDLLVVPPQLEAQAKLVVESQFLAQSTMGGVTTTGSTENIWRNTARVLMIPELATDPGGWYLIDSKKGMMPFVFQQRKAPELVTLTASSDYNVYRRNVIEFGIDTRGATFGGLWWLAAKAHS